MTRRRIVGLVQAGLALLAVLAALGIVRAEVVGSAPDATPPTDVAAGEAVDIVISSTDASQQRTGTFRLESIKDYPRLEPTSEYDDPIGRGGGRVVVAVIGCDCPVSDDLFAPTARVVDADGREWEAQYFGSPDNYSETAGLFAAYDLGDQPTVRYAEVFVVPADVGGSGRLVLQRSGDPAYRFAR